MKFTTLALALVCAPLVACAADETKTTQEESKAVPIFDGKTLNGWKKVGGTGEFKVEDGCIVGFGKNVRGNTFLRTVKEYGDFEFTYEFKFDDLTGNSGLMFRAQQKSGENGRVFGYQCEGDNTKRGWSAGLFDEARRGWLFPVKNGDEHKFHREWFSAEGNRVFKFDGWNTFKIRCKGNHIQTWLNGVKRVDFVDTDKENDTRKGFFGLQVHGGKSCNVRWRNLVIREL
ncbi:hypothetical protein Rhal01_02676 [Rubritalea halochordaticola]|uniref:3-keto-alpha-glucoside-1,2-lyase/3-keto-2-hydroxy-glucal hydratase domain-containing protein n=1 Tax=Rubritalea halochordaticola TaxID=714537 RepID=A0ABP9V786_9BACT